MQNKRLVVDPATCAPLLRLIAQVESKGNYNAYFGNAGNSSIDFTKMSIKEVMAWQAEHVSQGNLSDAVGRYQITRATLGEIVRQHDIKVSQKFDQPMQDRLAFALLARRGVERFINKELTREQFAANLAKEWAALPKVIGENPSESYYAGDGLNRALVGVDEVMQAVDSIGPKQRSS